MPTQPVGNNTSQVTPAAAGPTKDENELFNSALLEALQQPILQIMQSTMSQQLEIQQDSVES
ncbi:hypothetical protein IB262_33190 [Ensifer sp. ENS02]|uniref:hypothetical protein n=1 Tax=Ensifer sp. ENS02 TaxID=2769290 RepID=UPI00177D3873|nr:hypothetical protein [Ensifer sp. ENS02]MBD9524733.1 hypothetical protein [Ensifer sp. ENS02]